MAEKAKAVNYSAEQTAELVHAYVACGTDQTIYAQDARKAVVETFAVKFGKNTKSIIAKLTRESVYVKPERLNKAGEKVEAKEEIASAIAAVLGLDEASASSLAKANKKALTVIFHALANSKPLESGEDPAIVD